MSEQPELIRIVQHYVPLVGKGAVHRGYCPFCHSHSDNLFVRQDIQEWHCFECGAGGDVFDFVERMESIPRDDVPVFLDRLQKGEHTTPEAERDTGVGLLDDPRISDFFTRLRDIKGYSGAAILNVEGHLLHRDHMGILEPDFDALFFLLKGIMELAETVVPGSGSGTLGREIVFSGEEGAVVYLEIPISGELRTLLICLEDRNRATMARHYGYALRNQDELDKTVIITQLP